MKPKNKMQIEILTKNQAREMIKEEIERKFGAEFKKLWQILQELNDKIRISEENGKK